MSKTGTSVVLVFLFFFLLSPFCLVYVDLHNRAVDDKITGGKPVDVDLPEPIADSKKEKKIYDDNKIAADGAVDVGPPEAIADAKEKRINDDDRRAAERLADVDLSEAIIDVKEEKTIDDEVEKETRAAEVVVRQVETAQKARMYALQISEKGQVDDLFTSQSAAVVLSACLVCLVVVMLSATYATVRRRKSQSELHYTLLG